MHASILSENLNPPLKHIKGLWLKKWNKSIYIDVRWFNPIDEKYILFLFPQYKKIEIEE